MTVQFDLGNSSVKWRILDNGNAVARGFFSHKDDLPPTLVSRITQERDIQISSVANGAATERLLARLKALGASSAIFAESQQEQVGLLNAYCDPKTMGVDRWLAMLGAWRESREAFIVVDAGSAVTVDIVLSGGQHEGGFIIPGRSLMLAGLQGGTSRVLFDGRDDLDPEPGTDTQSCVSRGLSWLWRGLVSQIQLTAAARGIDAIWVTGGDARHLQEAGLQGRYVGDLVLDGLSLYCDNLPGSGARQ